MTDQADKRAVLEKTRASLRKAYFWAAVCAVGAVLALTAAHEPVAGWGGLGAAGAAVVLAFVGIRAIDRQIAALEQGSDT